jgi:hypothetical protein
MTHQDKIVLTCSNSIINAAVTKVSEGVGVRLIKAKAH